MSHYNLIIIGSGPSGRSAAIQAGKLKRRVLVIDRKDRVGGVSVHTGTIPSKTLRETVLNLSGWRERSFYGRSYRVKQEIKAEDLKGRLHMTLDHEVVVLEHQFVSPCRFKSVLLMKEHSRIAFWRSCCVTIGLG